MYEITKEVKVLIAEYLVSLKGKTGITNNEEISKMSNTAEGTVKNLCSAKVDNPGIISVAQVIYSLGGSLDEMFNRGKTKTEIQEVSILTINEIYANQFTAIKESYEEQTNNIRSHYEQHRQDVTENFEKRLADKREINEQLKAENTEQKTEIKYLKKVILWLCIVIGVLAAIYVVLFIMELMHPEHGWLRY